MPLQQTIERRPAVRRLDVYHKGSMPSAQAVTAIVACWHRALPGLVLPTLQCWRPTGTRAEGTRSRPAFWHGHALTRPPHEVQVMFAYATGPLAWSIVAFRNSLVFHSLDKVHLAAAGRFSSHEHAHPCVGYMSKEIC